MSKHFILTFLIILFFVFRLPAQEIREYVVKKTTSRSNIDGQLTEPDWEAAALTEKFIIYWDGSVTNLTTQAKLLWDDQFLYIGFICEDPDVWATFDHRDDLLWNEEVIEILCDPDGDGINYFEVQVNPLGTILDLLLNKPYFQGGRADLTWNLDSLKAAVWIDGTVNNLNDTDQKWVCEVALPFKELAFMAPLLNFPPKDGDQWRILLTRYDYERTADQTVEVSSWNQTDSRGFHVPAKFGRIIFSDEYIVSVHSYDNQLYKPTRLDVIKNFPNPFNQSTKIHFTLSEPGFVNIKILNLRGRIIETIRYDNLPEGQHEITWDSKGCPSGIYFCRIETKAYNKTSKLVLEK